MVGKVQLKLTLLFLCFCLGLSAQEQLYFEHYSSENGLSDNYVNAITQDKSGFIWVGTNYGLNRFDGEQFKIYTSSVYSSLLHNQIKCLALDNNSNLWCGSGNGVIVSYNPKNDDFKAANINDVYGTEFPSVLHLNKARNGQLFALTSSELYLLDNKTGTFLIKKLQFPTMQYHTINALYVDDKKNIWIGTNNGLYLFNTNGKQLALYSLSENATASISSLKMLDDRTMVVGTFDNGLWEIKFSVNTNVITPVKLETPFNDVKDLLLDSKERLWIGTRANGLWYMNAKQNFIHLETFQKKDIEIKSINTLFEDRKGNIWVGTQGHGLWCHKPVLQNSVNSSKDIGFPFVNVCSINEDNKGNLW